MIDPRDRGKRARRAVPLLSPEVSAVIKEAAEEHARDVGRNSGWLVNQANDTVHREAVAQWCSRIAAQSKGKIWPADASAAAASAYFQAAIESAPLLRSYTNQMAAILVPVLKRAVRSTRLHLLMRANEGVLGQGGPNTAHEAHAIVWELIYVPLARHILGSLASVRLVEALNGPGERAVHPFAWSPGIDSLHDALRSSLLGQTSPRLVSGSFLYSVFARYILRLGYAGIVPFRTLHCNGCKRPSIVPGDGHCAACGRELKADIKPQCLAIAYLQQCNVHFHDGGRVYYAPAQDVTGARNPAFEAAGSNDSEQQS